MLRIYLCDTGAESIFRNIGAQKPQLNRRKYEPSGDIRAPETGKELQSDRAQMLYLLNLRR
jgi:hypothetical protein